MKQNGASYPATAGRPPKGHGLSLLVTTNRTPSLNEPNPRLPAGERYEDGTFRPDEPVTRQEFAQMLYNYAAYKGYDLTAQGDLTQFPDGDSVQEWALPAMAWANGNSLINGHDDGTLEPGGTTIRSQAAAILMRFDQKLAE